MNKLECLFEDMINATPNYLLDSGKPMHFVVSFKTEIDLYKGYPVIYDKRLEEGTVLFKLIEKEK